jgi:hypothetical protein
MDDIIDLLSKRWKESIRPFITNPFVLIVSLVLSFYITVGEAAFTRQIKENWKSSITIEAALMLNDPGPFVEASKFHAEMLQTIINYTDQKQFSFLISKLHPKYMPKNSLAAGQLSLEKAPVIEMDARETMKKEGNALVSFRDDLEKFCSGRGTWSPFESETNSSLSDLLKDLDSLLSDSNAVVDNLKKVVNNPNASTTAGIVRQVYNTNIKTLLSLSLAGQHYENQQNIQKFLKNVNLASSYTKQIAMETKENYDVILKYAENQELMANILTHWL